MLTIDDIKQIGYYIVCNYTIYNNRLVKLFDFKNNLSMYYLRYRLTQIFCTSIKCWLCPSELHVNYVDLLMQNVQRTTFGLTCISVSLIIRTFVNLYRERVNIFTLCFFLGCSRTVKGSDHRCVYSSIDPLLIILLTLHRHVTF